MNCRFSFWGEAAGLGEPSLLSSTETNKTRGERVWKMGGVLGAGPDTEEMRWFCCSLVEGTSLMLNYFDVMT